MQHGISLHSKKEDFARAILEGRSHLVTGYDGLQVARIIEGIYRSNKEGLLSLLSAIDSYGQLAPDCR